MSSNQNQRKYPIQVWKSLLDIFICYFCFYGAWYLHQISIYFYPISFLICANRILALSLVCHEGLHGNISANKFINNLIGRYLCAIPSNISFSKYRRLHLFHHKALGHKDWDPDIHLYKDYPFNLKQYIKKLIIRMFTGQVLVDFLKYYTDLFELLSVVFMKKKYRSYIFGQSDFISFYLSWALIFYILYKYNLTIDFILFYMLPFILLVHPYVLFMGGLQHGPFEESKEIKLLSRSILKPKVLMPLLLPLDINFHAEHHMNSKIPHYWLQQYSTDLSDDGIKLWQEPYGLAAKRLFSK